MNKILYDSLFFLYLPVFVHKRRINWIDCIQHIVEFEVTHYSKWLFILLILFHIELNCSCEYLICVITEKFARIFSEKNILKNRQAFLLSRITILKACFFRNCV